MSELRDVIQHLKQHLDGLDSLNKFKSIRSLLTKGLRLADEGCNTETLLPCVVKYLSSTDMVSKKLALWFISNHGSHSHLLLAVNSLVKDCQDPSPMTRGAALKALTQLTHTDLIEYSIQAILRGLHDNSCYVRRVAVLGCAKVHRLQPQFILDRGVIDQLYGMIRDPDPIVMLNCLRSLDEILRNDGGVVINKKIHNYLLTRLDSLPAALLSDVMQYLQRYTPPSDKDVYDVMNVCDEYLNHSDASVVLPCLEYLLYLTRDTSAVNRQVLERGREPLTHLLNHSPPQLIFVLLNVIEKYYFVKDFDLFVEYYSSFLCKKSEPDYVKVRRMSLLCQLATDSNIGEILNELYVIATSGNKRLSRHAIECLGLVAEKKQQYLGDLVKKLTKLLSLEQPPICGPVIAVLSRLRLDGVGDDVLRDVMHQVCKVTLFDDDICAPTDVLWLLGEYCEYCNSSVYILEHYATHFEAWQDPELCVCLISAAIKLFLHRPAQCQHILGQILESAFQKGNFFTQQTVKYYYSLLRNDVKAATILIK